MAAAEAAESGRSEGRLSYLGVDVAEFSATHTLTGSGWVSEAQMLGWLGVGNSGFEATARLVDSGVFVRNDNHPTGSQSWLSVTDPQQLGAAPMLAALLDDLMTGSPMIGLDLLDATDGLELASAGVGITTYDGILDTERFDMLGVRASDSSVDEYMAREGAVTGYVRSDGLPERLRIRAEIGTPEDGWFVQLDVTYSDWGACRTPSTAGEPRYGD